MHPRTSPAILFFAASLALHLATYAWMRWAWSLPDTGFELTLPSTIELGIVEGTKMEMPAAAPPPAPPSTATEPAAPQPPSPARAAAKPPQPEGDEEAKPPPKPTKHPGPSQAVRESVAKNGLAALSPPGAQLALRIDLDGIRDSPLAPDVSDLLGGIPDVHALLDGSEIDLVRDVSRLFLASPNLQRSRVVMAGRYRGDDALPRTAAENLARARGKELHWQTTPGSIPVVNWENDDSTERVLALFGPKLFSITRADDLPRVLSIAQALAQRRRPAKGESAAEALLAMDAGQLVTFTAENAKLFARGATENVPDRLVIAAYAPEGRTIRVTGEAAFANEAQAERANEFWDSMRQRYLRSPLLAMLGVSGILERSTLTRKGASLALESKLQLDEVRLILRFVRDSLASRRRPAAARNSPSSADPPAQETP